MAGSEKLEIIKRIASGGMAELYLARQSGLSGIEKLVVMKQILPQYSKDAEFLRMFKDEARINALLQHPNLVSMYELGTREGLPFITMEYLNGEDVRSIYRELRERGQSLRVDHALNVIANVAAGLHYAHERLGLDGKPLNIVHRDISPQNVVVTYEGGVKLVDFGIAKSENRQHETKNAVLKGKIAYMSPEQVTGQNTDRRCDIYSVGVMLYEMTTGQRPFRSPSEVALMRMIADETIKPPKQLIPGYPLELQAIVLKATAKDPGERYQTAQELQGALEEFARKNGLSLSNIALSKFMHSLFGAKANAYREVLAGLKPVDALALDSMSSSEDQEPADADTDTASLKGRTDADGGERGEPTTMPGFEFADVERVGPVTVVHFKGKLTERFDGASLGRALSGHVVFDLARVERVTSFGVREWLQMLALAEPKLSSLYLARCSEAIVNQLSMIKKFAGSGKVASFLAPYACRSCSKTFQLLVDVNTHAALLEAQQMPPGPCPTCGKPGEFDDDARSFLAFSPTRLAQIPPPVATVLSVLGAEQQQQPEAIEKLIEGNVTRVKVRTALDGSIRWKRVLDGVEGVVTVDLTGIPSADEAGLKQFALALVGLGEEVSGVLVEGVTRRVAEHLPDAATSSRVSIASVQLEGRCDACDSSRTTLLRREELVPVLEQGKPPFAACKKCNAPLRFADADWLKGRLVKAGKPAKAAAPKPAPVTAVPVQTSSGIRAVKAAAAKATGRLWLVIAVGITIIVSLVVALFAMPRRNVEPPVSPAPGPVVTPPAPQPPTENLLAPQRPGQEPHSAPSFAATPFSRTDGFAWVVGHGGPAKTEAIAMEQARTAALLELSEALSRSLDPAVAAVVKKHVTASHSEGEALITAIKRRVGDRAALVLGESAVAEQDDGVEVWARFRLPEAGFDALKAEWGRTTDFRGASLMELPPEYRSATGDGALVVLRVEPRSATMNAGLRVGDLVLGVGKATTSTLSSLEQLGKGDAAKALSLRVSANGVARSLKVAP